MKTVKACHVGKHLLINDGSTDSDRNEVVVVELSPSGEYVKLRSAASDASFWEMNDEWKIKILEVLS